MSETGLTTDNLNVPPTADAVGKAEVAASALAAEHGNPMAPAVASVSLSAPQPDSSEASFQSLDPRIVSAERISNWIFLAVVAIGGLVAQVVYLALNWPPGSTASVISGGSAIAYVLLLIFLVWAGHFYPAKAYRHAAWRLNEQGLEIRRGVWWKHEITIPRARVQHTDVHQGPLMRKFGLARLVINTAGTQNASIALDGLSLETAQRLRSELVADCNAGPASSEVQ